jgi:fumarate reductase flavoprotein subunit
MPNTTFTGNAIARQKERTAFLIFDEAIKEHMETVGFDSIHVPFPFMRVDDLDGLIAKVHAGGYKDVFVADSLDDLAGQTGVDREGLVRTVEDYNRSCAHGYDEVFNKNRTYLRPVSSPRYYAARHLPAAYGSLGGIKINYRAEVLDKQWLPVPGLYAAGTDANSIYGDSYVFILPGNTMGFALNSGRIAGESAFEYVKSLG